MSRLSMNGASWKSKLRHVEYEDEKIITRIDYYRLDAFAFSPSAVSPSYYAESNSPLRSAITRVRVFVIDLGIAIWPNPLKKMSTVRVLIDKA